ncbi:MAG TPA: membrane-bound PQQ-dependent dehydrogenase, glucose/quinate/shikimate family [Sphingobium sp.]|nr:membrane-bound PQQ-dependent dehydrogenase, glucose/quinate/shikimate family [Sphingobium sp.]
MESLARRTAFAGWRSWTACAILVPLGAVLIWGGVILLSLGGSPYYVLAGLTLFTTATFAWRRERRAVHVYAAFLIATCAWAFYEVGTDGWQLMPRLVAPTVLAIVLLLLAGGAKLGRRFRNGAGLVLALVIAVPLGLLAHQTQAVRPDPMLERGVGRPTGQVSPVKDADSVAEDWRHYGSDRGGSRFSSLDQLTPANVGKLKLAWTYRAGILPEGNSGLQVTPLKVGDRLFLCTGYNDIISLDAETGKEMWRFRAKSDLRNIGLATCRGVAWYRAPGVSGLCAERIIAGTVDARLLAADAATGRPCSDFGNKGQVSLLAGMGKVIKGNYYVTSAPTVARGKVVIGGWVSDGEAWGEPSGVIRAFDAVTGRLAWAWDMGRPDRRGLPPGGEEYTRSTPNSWAPMSADDELGLVYIPTGNATPDYFGGQRRSFDDRYASSVVALDAGTGALRWSFQTTHHDLWDYDVASQPTLVDLVIDGRIRKALVQPTKRGEVFVLDRETGKPLKSVEERPVPTGGIVPGERVSPTQPFSTGMPSFRGPDLAETAMWGITPIDQLWCRIRFKQARYDGTMTPPGTQPNIAYPGFIGGMNWGGVSVDPERGLMVANMMRVPVSVQLVPRAEAERQGIRLTVGAPGRHQRGWQVQAGTPYAARVQPFLSPLGTPCNAPPYGLVSAVDLASGKLVWSQRLGTARDSGPLGVPSMLPLPMGLPNIGGSVVTRGGLVFIAASQERSLKALDVRTGKQLWVGRLPTGGHATPMTYRSPRSGRQFVLIAAGGNLVLNTPASDTIMAFALPK